MKTIRANARYQIKVKSSKFIANAHPISSVEQAKSVLGTIRKEFHDARHHCFAFKIGEGDRAITRTSDDGEPSGTAGAPILQVIEGNNFTNLLVVVTRYFGGTKLGIGGLARAYSEVTKEVLEIAKPKILLDSVRCEIQTNFADQSLVMRILNQFHARDISLEFSEIVIVTCEIEKSKWTEFAKELHSTSNGKIFPKLIE